MSQTYYNLGPNATQLRPVGSPYTGLAKVLALDAVASNKVLYVSASASDLRRFVALLGESAGRARDQGAGVGKRHTGALLDEALKAQDESEWRAARKLHDLYSRRFTAVVCEVAASCVTDVMDWVKFVRRCTLPVFVAYKPHGINTLVSKDAARLAASEVGASIHVAMAKSDWDADGGRKECLATYPKLYLDDGDDCDWQDMASWTPAVSAQHKRTSMGADTLWARDVKDTLHFKSLSEWVGAPLTEVQTLSELRYWGLSRLRATHDRAFAQQAQSAEQHVDMPGAGTEGQDAHASATGSAAAQRRDLFSSTRRLLALLPPAVRAAVAGAQPLTVTRADSQGVAAVAQRMVAQEGLYGGLLLAGRGWRSLWLHASGSAVAAPRVSLVVGVLLRLGYVATGSSRSRAGGVSELRVSMEPVAVRHGGRTQVRGRGFRIGSFVPTRENMATTATPKTSASNLPPTAISVASQSRSSAEAIYASRFPCTAADPIHARCLLYPQTAAEAALEGRTTTRVMTQKDIARGIAGTALVKTHSRRQPDGTMLLPIPPRAQWAEQRAAARIEVTYLGGSRTSLQCVSREVRQVMRPLPGYRFVSVDMVCAHLRIAEALCSVLSPSNKYFTNLFGGGDLYKAFGDLTGLTRDEAKKAAIMLLNGATAAGLLKEYPHLSEVACETAVAAWKKGNPWCTKTSCSIAGNAESAARYKRIPKFKPRATDKGASTYTSLWLQMEENRILQAALRDLGASIDLVLPMYDGALFVVPEGQEHAAADKVAAAFQRACVACGYPRIEVKAGVGETWGEAETSSTKRAAS